MAQLKTGSTVNGVAIATTSNLHSAVTVSDTTEIDLTLTGQQISAAIKSASIDETKLDTSVNASLDLADSALQTSDIIDNLTSTSTTDALSAKQGKELNTKILDGCKKTTGTEVATNEYIDSNRVYVKRINFGALPNATTKAVAHGLTNYVIVRLEALAVRSSDNETFPIPFEYNLTTNRVNYYISSSNINIATGGDRTAYNAWFTFYYTKTT